MRGILFIIALHVVASESLSLLYSELLYKIANYFLDTQ